jgi:hypothetical protein
MTYRKHLAALLVAGAALAAPAGAYAVDNDPTPGSGGCHYTDADGYDIPIDNGQSVFVDGKLVTCKSGTVIITTAPRTRPGAVKLTTVSAQYVAYRP